jgi:hypothetical protein
MKWLLLAVLLSIPQAPSPVPGKAANNDGAGSRKIKANGKADKKPTAAASVEKQVSAPSRKAESAQVPDADQEHPARITELPAVSIRRDWIDWLIVFLTALLIIVGAATGVAIWRQASLTKRSVLLQEAPLEQWLLFENWVTGTVDHTDGTTDLCVSFDILNPTNYPLTLRRVSVEIRRQPVLIGDRYVLAPGQPRTYQIPIKLTAEEAQKRRDEALVLVVMGYVIFEGILKREVEWPLTGILKCTERLGASFQPEHIAKDKKKNH